MNVRRSEATGRRVSRVAVAAALAASAIAIARPAAAGPAVNPVQNGVITSCFHTASGRGVRLVDSTVPQTACKPNETPLAWGQQGPKGDKGDKGDTGSPGTPGLSEYQTIPVSQPISAAGGWVFDAACPAGKTAISGGYVLPAGSNVQETHPRDGDPTVWRLAFTVPGPTTLKLYLQCARTQ
ncbi:MAG TPA: hypothetical protein VFD92_20100 [Candidatus Binatia bacterium]|nr:hypothetical protein [Candidatus Binatia bacterium]